MAYGAASVIGGSEAGDNSQWMVQNVLTPVSYTHLTLPTILLV